MFRPTLRTSRPIYTPCPVNRRHPLNSALSAWWTCLSGRMAGFTWYDVFGTDHGSLTSMGNASNGWRATTRLGGQGNLLFDGTAGYVNIPKPAVLPQGSTPRTIAIWAADDGTASIAQSLFAYGTGNTGLLISIAADVGELSLGFFGHRWGIASPGLGSAWHRLVFVYPPGQTSSNQWLIYKDGQKLSPTTLAGSPVTMNTGATFGYIGANSSLTGFQKGRIDDVKVCARAWSDADVAQDLALSRLSYPGVLNRWAMEWGPQPVVSAGGPWPYFMETDASGGMFLGGL
jgi:hypothetical protein